MTDPITFTLTDQVRRPEPDTEAVIKEAQLAVAWWRGVAVRTWAEQSLSRLELFVLEAALTMGHIDATELTEITGLPGNLLPALTRRLTGSQVLTAVGDHYTVEPERGRSVLAAGHLRVERLGRVDLVYLLETDELVALDQPSAKSPLSKLDNRRLDPALQVPVDERLAQVPRAAFLAQRFRENRIVGLSDRVFDILAPAGEPLLGTGYCPVYRCEAIVRRSNERRTIALTIQGDTVRKRRGEDSQQRQVSLRLTGADRLAAEWGRTGDLLANPLLCAQAWSAVTAGQQPASPPPATRVGPLTWRFRINGSTVDQLANTRRNLSRPLVLKARTNSHSAYMAVELAADDPHAAARIGVDRAIAAAERAAGDPSELHRTLAELVAELPSDAAGPLAPTNVLDRAWQLGSFQLAYALRQDEDFAYA